jgi:hypothetical protein
MPHFEAYPVRDRASWDFYRERMTPGPRWPADRLEAACRRFEDRRAPLCVDAGKTWGRLRDLVGPETACTILYDDPELAHEIIDWHTGMIEEHVFPLVERLRPEIVGTSEDCCFNHGMFFSPAHFEEFCAPFYRKLGGLARACGTDMVAVDTDGRLAEILPLLEACGVNAVHPCEAKAGNDLLDLGRRHPQFIFLGWLEKECLNEGQEAGIRAEIAAKVPPLLSRGRFFPNIDHLIQPLATFGNLCRFMTELHEATGNPEGEFPRMPA